MYFLFVCHLARQRRAPTFMMPFQLSPVETWKSVRNAMPKFSKVACRLMPSHVNSSLHTRKKGHEDREETDTHDPHTNTHSLSSQVSGSGALAWTGDNMASYGASYRPGLFESRALFDSNRDLQWVSSTNCTCTEMHAYTTLVNSMNLVFGSHGVKKLRRTRRTRNA